MHLLKIRYGVPFQNWRQPVCLQRGLDRNLWGTAFPRGLPLGELMVLPLPNTVPEAPPNFWQTEKVEWVGLSPHGSLHLTLDQPSPILSANPSTILQEGVTEPRRQPPVGLAMTTHRGLPCPGPDTGWTRHLPSICP